MGVGLNALQRLLDVGVIPNKIEMMGIARGSRRPHRHNGPCGRIGIRQSPPVRYPVSKQLLSIIARPTGQGAAVLSRCRPAIARPGSRWYCGRRIRDYVAVYHTVKPVLSVHILTSNTCIFQYWCNREAATVLKITCITIFV